MRTTAGGRAEGRARLQVAIEYSFISDADRTKSLRAARKLVSAAQTR